LDEGRVLGALALLEPEGRVGEDLLLLVAVRVPLRQIDEDVHVDRVEAGLQPESVRSCQPRSKMPTAGQP
jgi:hypothetical protein